MIKFKERLSSLNKFGISMSNFGVNVLTCLSHSNEVIKFQFNQELEVHIRDYVMS